MTDFEKHARAAEARGERDVARRLRTEGRICRRLATHLIAQGCRLAVVDGEEQVLTDSDSVAAVMASLGSVDEECIFVRRPPEALIRCGIVYLVYGNDGYDVISDYSSSLEELVAPVMRYADQLETDR